MEMYSIGKLSKIVNLTPDTLRYYDEIGLLKPALISPETGYRYYTLDQAKDLARILELKDFDFPLAEIKKIISRADAPGMEAILRKRYGELMQEKQRLTNAMEKLVQKLKTHEEESLMNKKILLVDDATFMRMMCRDILQKNGYEIASEAEDGEAGVDMFKQLNPDIVLLNVTMPKMDGIAALKKIREHNPQARVVMLTAMGQSVIVAEALLAGARRFVVKPFQPDKLIEEIRFTLLEENPKAEPFNAELLTKLLNFARGEHARTSAPGGDILSQWQIDEVIRLAEAPSATEEEIKTLMGKLFMAAHDMPPVMPAPLQLPSDPALLQSPFSPDPILSALEKLAAGQEKMTELLERLVAKG